MNELTPLIPLSFAKERGSYTQLGVSFLGSQPPPPARTFAQPAIPESMKIDLHQANVVASSRDFAW